MPKTTSPTDRETRRHPRFELYASVELQRGGESLVLPARNISLGGLFLTATGSDLDHVAIGEVVAVMLFDAVDEEKATVRADAQVVRKTEEGLALTWASTDPVVARKLTTLFARLNPLP